ncbi:MAG: M23 family metallopeptidase [Acidimicrobiales bacterium]
MSVREGGERRMVTGDARRVVAMAVLVALVTGGLTVVAGTASAQVTSVVGGATDYSAEATILGNRVARGPTGTSGCEPDRLLPSGAPGPTQACNVSVTLPAAGGSESSSDPDSSALARYGAGTLFSRGAATVSTQGTTGTAGSVTSTAEIHDVNTSGRELFTAASISSTCTASDSGVTGSTTITGGTLQISEGNPDLPGDERYDELSTTPAVNEAHPGKLETVGDSYEYRFNEQLPNADGSLTVYAAHLVMIGPTAVGDVYIGRVDCGVSPSHSTNKTGTSTTTALATTTTTAAGEGADRYGDPVWWPLRGTHRIGCTNMNGCDDGYHGYWALDLEAERGDEIYAAGAGQVTLAVDDEGGNCDFYSYPDEDACPAGSRGNRVVIKHDANGDVTTRYLHLTTVSVNAGDFVDENTVLGTAGDSGLAGPGYVHLHFEERARRPSGSVLDVDPVPLKTCAGGQLKTYPQDLGKSSWSEVTTYQFTVVSDGLACVGGGAAIGRAAEPARTRSGSSTASWMGLSALVLAAGALVIVGVRRRRHTEATPP